MVVLEYVLLIIFSYLIGNISWARIISKKNNGDITKSGSGNPGTMNMLRTYGAGKALLTLLLDLLKGLIPALAGKLLFKYTGLNDDIGLYLAGLSAIVGHMYPVIYKFKGGKGVATSLGVFMVANPLWLIASFIVGLFYVWFFDYGSVASLFIVATMSIIQGYQNSAKYATGSAELLSVNLLLFAIFALIWFAHRTNIVRLLLGKENKANLQKSFKKKLQKQKKEEVKTEYQEQKSELKQEFKALKAEYRRDVKAKKKELKKQYKQIERSLKQSTADIMANEIEENVTDSEANAAVENITEKENKTEN